MQCSNNRCDHCKQQRFSLHLLKQGAFCHYCLADLAQCELDRREHREGGRVQTAAGLGASTGHRKTIGGAK